MCVGLSVVVYKIECGGYRQTYFCGFTYSFTYHKMFNVVRFATSVTFFSGDCSQRHKTKTSQKTKIVASINKRKDFWEVFTFHPNGTMSTLT